MISIKNYKKRYTYITKLKIIRPSEIFQYIFVGTVLFVVSSKKILNIFFLEYYTPTNFYKLNHNKNHYLKFITVRKINIL